MGIVVMLAGTDVGSIVTAGQSGVQYRYQLLLLELILVPILFLIQELTVRLSIFTGRGHGNLIREHFGKGWAWISIAGLGIATVGAMLTEFAGVAGVGEMYGVTRGTSLTLATVALLCVVASGSYRRVERAAIGVGPFEFAIFFVALRSHPSLTELRRDMFNVPVRNVEFQYLVAANIGAVIMPWMIFYQQSAIADKGLKPEHFGAARLDTAIGAVITQLVMSATLIVCAATIARTHPSASLSTLGETSQALAPLLEGQQATSCLGSECWALGW